MLTQAQIERDRAQLAALQQEGIDGKAARERRDANRRRARQIEADLIRSNGQYRAGKKPRLSEAEAVEYVKRSPRTLRRWASTGVLTAYRTGAGARRYSRLELFVARKLVAENYQNRKSTVSPGRPRKEAERERVVALLAADSSVSNREAARRLGVSHAFVGSVRREWMKKSCRDST